MGALIVLLLASALYDITPAPRWDKDPENGPLCAAIRAECAGQFPDGNIDATMAFDELHDTGGRLSGMRLVRSTGCKPLDEAMLLGRKEFRQRFEADGSPTLDDITVEVKPGIDPAAVRIVRRVDNLQIGIGC